VIPFSFPPGPGRHTKSWTQIFDEISITHNKALYEMTPAQVPLLLPWYDTELVEAPKKGRHSE